MHNRKVKPWIYTLLERVSNLSLFIVLVYFFTYFISINQGLSKSFQLNIINIISYIALTGILFSIFSFVSQIIKGSRIVFTIGKLLLELLRIILLLFVFIVINVIYTISY